MKLFVGAPEHSPYTSIKSCCLSLKLCLHMNFEMIDSY